MLLKVPVFFGNDGSDVGHDADVIVSHYAQG